MLNDILESTHEMITIYHQGQTMLYSRELDIPVITVTMTYYDYSLCLVFSYTKSF